jgi:hypothetical protein
MKQQTSMPKQAGVAWWGQWLAPADMGGGTLTAGQRARRAVRSDGFAVTQWSDTEWDVTQSSQLDALDSGKDSP